MEMDIKQLYQGDKKYIDSLEYYPEKQMVEYAKMAIKAYLHYKNNRDAGKDVSEAENRWLEHKQPTSMDNYLVYEISKKTENGVASVADVVATVRKAALINQYALILQYPLDEKHINLSFDETAKIITGYYVMRSDDYDVDWEGFDDPWCAKPNVFNYLYFDGDKRQREDIRGRIPYAGNKNFEKAFVAITTAEQLSLPPLVTKDLRSESGLSLRNDCLPVLMIADYVELTQEYVPLNDRFKAMDVAQKEAQKAFAFAREAQRERDQRHQQRDQDRGETR